MTKKTFNTIFKSEKFKNLLKAYKVKRAAIFGSYAKGMFRKGSDIDFLVEFQKEADLFDQVGLRIDLKKLFHRDVDVVTPKSLSQYIRRQILEEAVYL